MRRRPCVFRDQALAVVASAARSSGQLVPKLIADAGDNASDAE
jgi:hypothetical protein